MSLAPYQDPDERDDARYDATLTQPAGPLRAELAAAIVASRHALEARQRDAARRAEEERGETAREWALNRIAERLPS